MGKPLIGFKISELRRSQGLSQEELAEKSGVARRAIQRLENGEGGSTLSTVETIVNALGNNLILFLGDSEDSELFDIFGRANIRNRALILGYARGLLDSHQTEPSSRGKRSK